MKTRTQLVWGGALLSLLVGGYCVFVIYSQNALSRGFEHLVEANQQASDKAASLSESATETSQALTARARGFSRFIGKAETARKNTETARAELEKYFSTARQTLADMESRLSTLTYNDAERIKAQFEQLRQLQRDAYERGMKPLAASTSGIGYVARALKVNINSLQYIATQISSISEEIGALTQLNNEMKNNAIAFGESIAATKKLFIILALPLIGGVLLGALITARRISGPLQLAANTASAIADGDLSRRIDIDPSRKDEFGQLLGAMARMQERLQQEIRNVVTDADAIHRTMADISAGNRELSARNQQQSEDLAATAEHAHALMETVRQNTEYADSANTIASDAMRLAEKGGEVVSDTIRAMGEINAVSQKMSEIIDLIDELSFQTNLLALNAAVEAARAGDQGRGFAVVAGEVRNLAQKSAESANQIRALINDSLEKAASGETLANQSGEALSLIVTRVKEVNSVLGQIVGSSTRQLEGIERINASVLRLEAAVEENHALSDQTRGSSERLLSRAEASQSRVKFFRLESDSRRERPESTRRDKQPSSAKRAQTSRWLAPLRKAG